jgi:uracil-DNA glycosylase
VAAWRDTLDSGIIPLPHPSWRTTAWQRKNPWFDTELLTELRDRVHTLLSG